MRQSLWLAALCALAGTAVLLTLVGADAADLLRKANMAVPGGTLSNHAAQRLPGPALLRRRAVSEGAR